MFPGWPIPSSLLVAVGARRSGPWLFGFAIAIVTTVISFGSSVAVLGWNHPTSALMVGAVIGVLAGVALDLIGLSARSACLTYPDQVKELRERIREADGRLQGSSVAVPADQAVSDNVTNLLCSVVTALKQDGPEWLDASGFLDCWSTLHEAEENLLLIESEDEVVSSAMYDLLRLTGSTISARDGLTAELKAALPYLSNAAATQIGSAPVVTNPGVARRRIRAVRMAIEQDREQQWDQIVRSRNGLITAGVVAMGIAYWLVILAVGVSAAPKTMESALVFALIGALVSATYQLLVRSDAQNEVEDFGFSTVKLVIVPILAAVTVLLAIVLVTEFQLVVGGQTIGGSFSSWQATFDWRKNTGAVAIALLVGFAPSFFFQFVQSKVDDALAGIKSSQASSGSSR